jgi:hypothetical protein
MTLINFGIALVIFLVLKPWRFFEGLDLSWLPDGEARTWVYRHEAPFEPADAAFTFDGRTIVD